MAFETSDGGGRLLILSAPSFATLAEADLGAAPDSLEMRYQRDGASILTVGFQRGGLALADVVAGQRLELCQQCGFVIALLLGGAVPSCVAACIALVAEAQLCELFELCVLCASEVFHFDHSSVIALCSVPPL